MGGGRRERHLPGVEEWGEAGLGCGSASAPRDVIASRGELGASWAAVVPGVGVGVDSGNPSEPPRDLLCACRPLRGFRRINKVTRCGFRSDPGWSGRLRALLQGWVRPLGAVHLGEGGPGRAVPDRRPPEDNPITFRSVRTPECPPGRPPGAQELDVATPPLDAAWLFPGLLKPNRTDTPFTSTGQETASFRFQSSQWRRQARLPRPPGGRFCRVFA